MLANFIEETCTGTGDLITLSGATLRRIDVAKAYTDGQFVYYAIEDGNDIVKASGKGTYNVTGNTITRNDTWTWDGTTYDISPAANITLSGGTHTIRVSLTKESLDEIATPTKTVIDALGVDAASLDGVTWGGVDTEISTDDVVESGRGNGGVALTLDGGASVTFNHKGGSADQAGNTGGITVNTDATTEATMIFSGKSNDATGAVTNATIATMYADSGDFLAVGNVSGNSDRRIKTDLRIIDDALWKVGQLNGYTFDRTDIKTKRQTGVVAQEVQSVLPEAVIDTNPDCLGVAYGNMVGLLIEAIKELTDRIKVLEGR